MELLIQSSDLFVMQVEMDVYTALKKVHNDNSQKRFSFLRHRVSASLSFLFLPVQWMFLQLNPLWDGPIKQLLADADTWLCKRRTGTSGQHLVKLFLYLSFVYLAC